MLGSELGSDYKERTTDDKKLSPTRFSIMPRTAFNIACEHVNVSASGNGTVLLPDCSNAAPHRRSLLIPAAACDISWATRVRKGLVPLVQH